MSDTFAQFEKRLDSLERKHRELAKGYVTKINPDGLITVEPGRGKGGLRLRPVLFMISGFFVIKALMMSVIGTATYDARVADMAAGTGFEQLGAWVMQSDPLSRAITDFLAKAI